MSSSTKDQTCGLRRFVTLRKSALYRNSLTYYLL